jgi:hypothetical protein
LAGNEMNARHYWEFTTAGPIPIADMPLTPGMTWTYQASWTNVSNIGVRDELDGSVVLHVEGPVTWQGRDASRLVRYDIEAAPSSHSDSPFRVTVLYVFQSSDGLEVWVPTSGGEGQWRRILFRHAHAFPNNHFLLVPDPVGPITILNPSSTMVPAGSFATVRARVSQSTEDRSEHYADGVGLVHGVWSYMGTPSAAGDFPYADGTIELTHVDAGEYADVRAEAEPNDVGTAEGSQAIPRVGIVSARIANTDASTVVTHADVLTDFSGLKKIHDWYRFEMPVAGAFRLDLEGRNNNLRVYLFREETDGSLTYVAQDLDEIVLPSLASGVYYIGVQARSTPAGPVEYWFVTR